MEHVSGVRSGVDSHVRTPLNLEAPPPFSSHVSCHPNFLTHVICHPNFLTHLICHPNFLTHVISTPDFLNFNADCISRGSEGWVKGILPCWRLR